MMSDVILGTYWVPVTALSRSVPERYLHATVWTLAKTARTLMQWGMSTSIFISLLTFANVSKSIEYMFSAADDGDAGHLISFGSEKYLFSLDRRFDTYMPLYTNRTSAKDVGASLAIPCALVEADCGGCRQNHIHSSIMCLKATKKHGNGT